MFEGNREGGSIGQSRLKLLNNGNWFSSGIVAPSQSTAVEASCAQRNKRKKEKKRLFRLLDDVNKTRDRRCVGVRAKGTERKETRERREHFGVCSGEEKKKES